MKKRYKDQTNYRDKINRSILKIGGEILRKNE